MPSHGASDKPTQSPRRKTVCAVARAVVNVQRSLKRQVSPEVTESSDPDSKGKRDSTQSVNSARRNSSVGESPGGRRNSTSGVGEGRRNSTTGRRNSTQRRRSSTQQKTIEITITLVSSDGSNLSTARYNATLLIRHLAREAAMKLGARRCHLFESARGGVEKGHLNQKETILQAGIRDGTVLTALPAHGVRKIVSTEQAFCMVLADGSLVVIGDENCGGKPPESIAERLHNNVVDVLVTKESFCALRNDGSVIGWGGRSGNYVRGPETLCEAPQAWAANAGAFAVLCEDGAVRLWGDESCGGDQSTVTRIIATDDVHPRVKSLHATDGAFVALREDGSMVACGSEEHGGAMWCVTYAGNDPDEPSPTKRIVAGSETFLAMRANGSIAVWGNQVSDLDHPAQTTGIEIRKEVWEVFAAKSIFMAVCRDGTVVTWGDCPCQGRTWGDCLWCEHKQQVEDQLRGGILQLTETRSAVAVIKWNRSVLTWGNPKGGADSRHVSHDLQQDVTKIVATDGAFAALKSSGSVIAWGNHDRGGSTVEVNSFLRSGVKEVVRNKFAFAALKDDGSVVTWGSKKNGGYLEPHVVGELSSGVIGVSASLAAFAAWKVDGTVVLWGHMSNIGFGSKACKAAAATADSFLGARADSFLGDHPRTSVAKPGSSFINKKAGNSAAADRSSLVLNYRATGLAASNAGDDVKFGTYLPLSGHAAREKLGLRERSQDGNWIDGLEAEEWLSESDSDIEIWQEEELDMCEVKSHDMLAGVFSKIVNVQLALSALSKSKDSMLHGDRAEGLSALSKSEDSMLHGDRASSPDAEISCGAVVALRSVIHNQFVSMSKEGQVSTNANKDSSTLFEVVDAEDGKVALHNAEANRFVRINPHADVDSSKPKNANEPLIPWERFTSVQAGHTEIAFHNESQNRFLRMNDKSSMDSSGDQNVDSLPPSWTWERFTVILEAKPPSTVLQVEAQAIICDQIEEDLGDLTEGSEDADDDEYIARLIAQDRAAAEKRSLRSQKTSQRFSQLIETWVKKRAPKDVPTRSISRLCLHSRGRPRNENMHPVNVSSYLPGTRPLRMGGDAASANANSKPRISGGALRVPRLRPLPSAEAPTPMYFGMVESPVSGLPIAGAGEPPHICSTLSVDGCTPASSPSPSPRSPSPNRKLPRDLTSPTQRDMNFFGCTPEASASSPGKASPSPQRKEDALKLKSLLEAMGAAELWEASTTAAMHQPVPKLAARRRSHGERAAPVGALPMRSLLGGHCRQNSADSTLSEP